MFGFPHAPTVSHSLNASTIHCFLCFTPCWRQGSTLGTMEGNRLFTVRCYMLFSRLRNQNKDLGKAASQHKKTYKSKLDILSKQFTMQDTLQATVVKSTLRPSRRSSLKGDFITMSRTHDQRSYSEWVEVFGKHHHRSDNSSE